MKTNNKNINNELINIVSMNGVLIGHTDYRSMSSYHVQKPENAIKRVLKDFYQFKMRLYVIRSYSDNCCFIDFSSTPFSEEYVSKRKESYSNVETKTFEYDNEDFDEVIFED